MAMMDILAPFMSNGMNRNLRKLGFDKNGLPILEFHDDLKERGPTGEIGGMRGTPKTTPEVSDYLNLQTDVQEPKQPNFLGGATTPNYGAARLLAMIGQSLAAVEPNSWQNQLSGMVGQYAAGQQSKALREGKELTGIAGFGITPQERAAIATEALGERRVRAEERRGDIAEEELGIQRRRTDIEEERVGKIPTAEEEMAIRAAGASTKGLQMRTIPVDGKDVSVLFNPDPNNPFYIPIASSPIQQADNTASLRTDQRQWYNVATKQAASELARLGYGSIIQLADGSWTIKYDKEITGDEITEANSVYNSILKRRLGSMVEVGKIPKSFLELEGTKEDFEM